MSNLPKTQYAIQLTAPDNLVLNESKEVYNCGPHQIVAEVLAVGLCYSDVKLLKQFAKHARKGPIVSGIDTEVLENEKSYRPDDEPTVPGHEVCCKIIAVGEKVKYHKIGQHVLVQADFRWLKTEHSNGAFGYNIEGALQQYITLDERIFVDPVHNESYLLDVDTQTSPSAIALVEPWTCVESSYISPERQTVTPGKTLLVAAEKGYQIKGVKESFSKDAPPNKILACCADQDQLAALKNIGIEVKEIDSVDEIDNESILDIIYFGNSKAAIEKLNDKLAKNGVINIVLAGNQIGEETAVDVGNVHYGLTRWIGTMSDSAEMSYKHIPATGEIRKADNILVIGAAGPMGQMHVIRLACSGVENISITGTDFDDQRLESLNKKAAGPAAQNSVELKLVNPSKNPLKDKFTYFGVMAPVSGLIAQSIKDAAPNAIINIFAGIPAGTKQLIDLDTYISNKCYMFGTSGSTLDDMKIVMNKVSSGQLDTNLSVDAVCGMAGAIEGVRAVENRLMAGKIIVYPKLEQLGLVNLEHLKDEMPDVAEKLNNGLWTKQAEEQLLKTAK